MQVATLFREEATLDNIYTTSITEPEQFLTVSADVTPNQVSLLSIKSMSGDGIDIKNPTSSELSTNSDIDIGSNIKTNIVVMSDKAVNSPDDRKRKSNFSENEDLFTNAKMIKQKQHQSNITADHEKKTSNEKESFEQGPLIQNIELEATNSSNNEFNCNLKTKTYTKDKTIPSYETNEKHNTDDKKKGVDNRPNVDPSNSNNEIPYTINTSGDTVLTPDKYLPDNEYMYTDLIKTHSMHTTGNKVPLLFVDTTTQSTYNENSVVGATKEDSNTTMDKKSESEIVNNLEYCQVKNVPQEQKKIAAEASFYSNNNTSNTNSKQNSNDNDSVHNITTKYTSSYDIRNLVESSSIQPKNKNTINNCLNENSTDLDDNKDGAKNESTRTEFFLYTNSHGCVKNHNINNSYNLKKEHDDDNIKINHENINNSDNNVLLTELVKSTEKNPNTNSITFHSDKELFINNYGCIKDDEYLKNNRWSSNAINYHKRLNQNNQNLIEETNINQKKYFTEEEKSKPHNESLANSPNLHSYQVSENIQELRLDSDSSIVTQSNEKNENGNFKVEDSSTLHNIRNERLYSQIELQQYNQQNHHIVHPNHNRNNLQLQHQNDLENFDQSELYHQHQRESAQVIFSPQPISLHHQMQSQIEQLRHNTEQNSQNDQRDQLQMANSHSNLMSYLQHDELNNNLRVQSQHQQLHEHYQQNHHQQQNIYLQEHGQSNLLMTSLQQQGIEHNLLTSKQKSTLATMDDLILDEFHDERNAPYKLGLSPTTTKQENQDDGYETSAGDVLTPNSSSTHSVTPLHQIQHTGGLIQPKCDERSQQMNMLNNGQKQLNMQMNKNHSIDISANITKLSDAHSDPFSFMTDTLVAGNEIRIMTPNSTTASHESRSNYLNMNDRQNENLFALQSRSQQHEMINDPAPLHVDQHQEYHQQLNFIDNNDTVKQQKRRGRKKKNLDVDGLPLNSIPNLFNSVKPGILSSADDPENNNGALLKTKERKKHDRFNGMSEEDVIKRTLPDHLCDNLDIVIIGINPGLFAAYKGHHYAGPGNHFWKCLYLSGLTEEQMSADEDYKLIECGIGFTNMVQRATKGSADLTRKEIKEGSKILLDKLQKFRPKIAVFNGKLIFEVFSGKKEFHFGRQPECVDGTNTYIWVMPSSSARCAQLPRAADKVPFYAALKKFRDYLNGVIPHIEESECIFTEQSIRQCCEQENVSKNLIVSNCNREEHVNIMYTNNPSNANIISQHTEGVDTNQNNIRYDNAHSSFIYNTTGSVNGASSADRESSCGDSSTNRESNRELSSNNEMYMRDNVMRSFQNHSIPEKKKRGRPKKIKTQEIIDPATGNKISINNMQVGMDCNNILNLSMVSNNAGEVPKKKRGRPKKLKLIPSEPSAILQKANSSLLQTPEQRQLQQQSQSMFLAEPSPTNFSNKLYPTPSPIHSPAIHSTSKYVAGSSPITIQSNQQTPPLSKLIGNRQEESKELISVEAHVRDTNTGYYPTQLMSASKITAESTLPSVGVIPPSESQSTNSTPSPNSSNICGVDFERGTNINNIVGNNQNIEMQQRDILEVHQRLSYDNSTSELPPEHATNNHFQWLPSQQIDRIHHPHSDNINLNYREPNIYNMQCEQLEQQHQSQSENRGHMSTWQQHQQCFDNSNYMFTTQALHQTENNHQRHSQELNNCISKTHKQISSSDVSSKSLSGLESLVDQIPTIAESDNSVVSSAMIGTNHTLESNLHVLSNQHNQNSQHSRTSVDFGTSTTNGGSITDGTPDSLPGGSSGNVTPHNLPSIYATNSPGSFSINRINSTSAGSSPQLLSPQQIQQTNQSHSYEIISSVTPSTTPVNSVHVNSPTADRITVSSENCTPPTTTTVNAITTRNSNSISNNPLSNIHNNSFSVSNLAASSVRSNAHNENYASSAANNTSTYHHHSSFHTPVYLDHTHAHQRYENAGSHYLFTAQNLHHPHHHHPAYGTTYDNTYRNTASQALHIPSPNYPYSYGAPTPTATNYATAIHAHHQPTPTPQPPTPPSSAVSALTAAAITYPHHSHLSMYERLKPSDLGGYGGF
ncbi:uncharacterized protein LOC119685616 isoform X2 [Teleopsis dalmanni]|uniref:uncharacterized protein LOC119685616 isoform X2 n=1 Tax=Teleopsis dalmanni TaxID=139649 RepID=UPI0018CF321E|nr:uncharacterized protein LOC119685616 isoform X2 [Teleopsis dalmanni]